MITVEVYRVGLKISSNLYQEDIQFLLLLCPADVPGCAPLNTTEFFLFAKLSWPLFLNGGSREQNTVR